MKVGIVGVGQVGSALLELFPDAVVYDGPKQVGTQQDVNGCDIVFVCVPTPSRPDGSCDISVVDDVLSWLEARLIVIRSTVPVGYTDAAIAVTGKRLVFQPEFLGETPDHPLTNNRGKTWITLGGSSTDIDEVLNLYRSVFNSETRVSISDARTAELAKYMDNTFLATKVTFCNEFFDIAESFGVNYNKLREVWLMDPRVDRSHTLIWHPRGYGGACLPKDIAAITLQAKERGVDTTLLDAVQMKNHKLRKNSQS